MSKLNNAFSKRSYRVRNKIRKVAKGMPRLSVFRSNNHIYAQLIDDAAGKTIVSVSSKSENFKTERANVKLAHEIGKKIGELSVKAGVKQAVFDKGGYYYHGKVKAVAEGAREAKLKI